MSTTPNKICPFCQGEFRRSKRAFVKGVNANLCPHCLEPLFYRRIRGELTVVSLEDKLCVDRIIAKLNGRLEAEPDEATQRERKFAYDLVEWVKKFMAGREHDVGLNHYEFTEELIGYILGKEWWDRHMKSLLMIQNVKSRFAMQLYDYLDGKVEIFEDDERIPFSVFAELKAMGIG